EVAGDALILLAQQRVSVGVGVDGHAGHSARPSGSCRPPCRAAVLRQPSHRPQGLCSVRAQSPKMTLLFLLTQLSKLAE
ncbi:hypothetical protein NL466_30105, partial [Klebsiella pneumoniae]|nr:hypothetical protein [Klebsiella pneumoniae]